MLKIHEIIAKAAGKPLSAEECAELKAMAEGSGAENNSALFEIRRLQHELENAVHERDAAKNELNAAIRKNRISALAAQYRFSDPEYLDFLAGKQNVNLDDQAQTEAFMHKINLDKPRFFNIEINSGAGGGINPTESSAKSLPADDAASAPPYRRNNAKEIARMLEDAPEADF